ncbi:rhomboid family intramembrane serine protease [Mucilaginibacter sp.]|uniref:rhomboid family intramembrane serine protease n=1 Tax=Mucilaginibacter sp. TaxID=1882438 RepID=UPI0035BBD9BC
MELLQYAPVASVIFILTIATSLWAFNDENIYARFILNPYGVSRGERVYAVITSGFIHKDWNHLLFNMFSYFFFAFQLEELIGHWQFGLLYMLSLILSDLPSIQKHKEDIWYNSLGASGAVSAVIFSYIMYNPLASLGIMFIPIPIPAWIFGILYLVYCHFASKHARDNVNHDAHLFGAISGLVITIALSPHVVHDFITKF